MHPTRSHPITLLIGFMGLFSLLIFPSFLMAGEPITGFRDLKFGMTPKEVSGLQSCTSGKECIYELSEKNRYLELWYMGDSTEDVALETALKGPGSGLARISIDMGQYTEDWYKQLQRILGNSYQLTHDISEKHIQAFLAEELPELTSGYENGQVLLSVRRRPYGNMILRVIYQSPEMAQFFLTSHPPT
ncbi:MAG: hypothetical protein KC643_07125 [Nitrospira sp.]|nr:hypothetical protein [Nitrospira sp.]MCB9711825.1 hypothetical protein [Nitrospiraceae bacterium]HQU29131.1 hypothetical protein [Nitrospirales bacterium]